MAARACGFMVEGREGEAESRVVCVGFLVSLVTSGTGEAARRAAREWTVTSVFGIRMCCGGKGGRGGPYGAS